MKNGKKLIVTKRRKIKKLLLIQKIMKMYV